MGLNKQQMLKVSQFIGKNMMKGIKLKKEYSEQWLEENKDNLLQACTIDTETTGLCPLEDEILELAIRPFLFHKETYEVVKVLEPFDEFQEPSSMDKLTKEIQELTHITPEMVKGKTINWKKASEICDACEFLIAHNADFDKTMLSQVVEFTSVKPWYCTFLEVDWFKKGLPNRKQEILGPSLSLIDESLAFDFEAHRALNDVDALLQLIINLDLLEEVLTPSVELRVSGFVSSNFYELYWKRNRCYFKVDKVKDASGKWVKDENGKFVEDKYCSITIKKSKVQEFKEKSEAKAKRINSKAELLWRELPLNKK